jgi:chromosome segregation ATPase
MKEDEIVSLRKELVTVDKRLTEKTDQLGRCETVIDHLSTEVKDGQDDLNKAIDKIAQYEHNIVNYKEQVALLQHEVSSLKLLNLIVSIKVWEFSRGLRYVAVNKYCRFCMRASPMFLVPVCVPVSLS